MTILLPLSTLAASFRLASQTDNPILTASPGRRFKRRAGATTQLLRIMKVTVFILIAFCLHVAAAGFSQSVTLKVENKPLISVLRSIERQTGLIYIGKKNLLESSRKLTLNLENVPVQQALAACFEGQPLVYSLQENVIIIKPIDPSVVVSSDRQPLNGLSDSFANNKGIVSGFITDADGNPLEGATVVIRGTNKLVSTNANGFFSLQVFEGDVLIVSCIGHETEEIKITASILSPSNRQSKNGSSKPLSITLKSKIDKLDESIVVAYNTTTQRNNVASVSVVKAAQIENLPVRSIDKALQGLVPGLLVTSGSGQPGSGLTNFVVRGISTATDPFSAFSTVRNPLIVMDGVPINQDNYQWAAGTNTETPIINPMAQLNMADIESITVLKDAAAISLYGSKASNGVILITTKKGKVGKTIIGFHTQADISSRLKGKVEWVNQAEYLELVSETLRNYDPTKYPDEVAVTKDLKTLFPVRSDGSFYPFTNWEDEIYTKMAGTVANNLSFTGGNDKNSFYLNLGYTKQNGVVRKTGFDQKSIRFNMENRPITWLKVGLNSGLSYNVQDYGVPLGNNIAASPDDSPLNPIRLEDGSYFMNFVYPTFKPNPVAANEYNTNKNKSYRGITKLNADVNFLKNLKFSSALGIDFMMLEAKEVMAPGFFNPSNYSSDGLIRERNTRTWNLIATNQLTYTNRLGKDHYLNILLGQEAQSLTTKWLEGKGKTIQMPGLNQLSGTATQTSTGGEDKRTLLSWFGQTNYGYKNRYFLSASVRADGSSNFGEHNRFGTFWSTGAGWVVSEEKFMKGGASWLSYLKLRGSLGAAGNSFAIDRFTRYDRLFYGNYLNSLAVYPDLGSLPSNPDIQWEKTFTWDAGIEARLWKDRIVLSADFYEKKTSNVVASILLPYVTGYKSVLDNIGDINNKGIELSIAVDMIKDRNFKWTLNANWSTNKNTLVSTSSPLSYVGGFSAFSLANIVGKPLNSFYMIRWAGVNPADGAAMWIDSTGKSNVNPSAAKPEYVGKPSPDGFGAVTNSFTYKNIQISALFYYQYGCQALTTDLINDGNNAFQNQDKRALNRWQKPGDMVPNPKRTQFTNSQTPSTRILSNSDYLRFQTLTIGYTFPASILSRLRVNMLKVYAQAYNLAVWTNYPGYDMANISPVGSVSVQYPNGRSFSIGFDLNF